MKKAPLGSTAGVAKRSGPLTASPPLPGPRRPHPAIRLRHAIEGEWLLALSGVLSIAFGVLMLRFPGAGALAVIWWIGAFAIAMGTLLVVLGFRVRAFVPAVRT